MSLVVASAESTCVWMVSDTAITGITGPDQSERERINLPNVECWQDNRALMAFAGEPHPGMRLVRATSAKPAGDRGLQVLVRGGAENHSVEFAYAYFDGNEPQLYHVARGFCYQKPVLHLGNGHAFGTFQTIRHREKEPYLPKAHKTLFVTRPDQAEGIATAIYSPLDLFATREERE